MIATLRADLIRVATLRSSYVLAVVLLGLVAAIVAGSLTQAGSAGMTTATQLREPLTASTGIMLAVGMALFAVFFLIAAVLFGIVVLIGEAVVR